MLTAIFSRSRPKARSFTLSEPLAPLMQVRGRLVQPSTSVVLVVDVVLVEVVVGRDVLVEVLVEVLVDVLVDVLVEVDVVVVVEVDVVVLVLDDVVVGREVVDAAVVEVVVVVEQPTPQQSRNGFCVMRAAGAMVAPVKTGGVPSQSSTFDCVAVRCPATVSDVLPASRMLAWGSGPGPVEMMLPPLVTFTRQPSMSIAPASPAG